MSGIYTKIPISLKLFNRISCLHLYYSSERYSFVVRSYWVRVWSFRIWNLNLKVIYGISLIQLSRAPFQEGYLFVHVLQMPCVWFVCHQKLKILFFILIYLFISEVSRVTLSQKVWVPKGSWEPIACNWYCHEILKPSLIFQKLRRKNAERRTDTQAL